MEDRLKSYPPPWDGELLLACRKCQKKLRGERGMRALVKLKKTVKRHNKEHPDARFHLVSVPCMDVCPKGGLTVCLAERQPAAVSILRAENELGWLSRRDGRCPSGIRASGGKVTCL